MRVNKWGIGVALAAAIMLTACAGPASKPADEKPSNASSEEAAAPSSDCPELAEGATVDIKAMSVCSADSMKKSKGYAATSTSFGLQSTARFNPPTKSVEIISSAGSLIVIGDDAWVKSSTSEWQVADPKSTDPIISGLSTAAASANSQDPAATAAALTGEFTVTGTGERLGQKVFIVTGTTEQSGATIKTTFEVTKDYIILATAGHTEVNGQSVDSTLEVTEWNKSQDIVAPM
ncbi:hypothetical protein ITJ38_14810 [Agreia pratensis]|uniref:hypothetical protein n=1 Tax=Agreia pratensis TaxID=150121 RepID=UPI00188D7F56|nr:hypothetical protein [Agreia pratensis]MBF4635681.1 hypothetical protein [Agreia pratensis]